MNKRTNQRLHLQHSAKLGILHDNLPNVTPRMTLKPIISNISFGGMGLLFIPEIEDAVLDVLLSGKSNVYIEFFLPPSLKTINVTGKVKWIRRRELSNTSYTHVGIEFITKTQELYREIDKFLKTPSPASELLKNQRFFPRVYSEINAQFSIAGIKKLFFLQKFFSGQILNISAVGALLEVDPPLSAKICSQIRKRPELDLKFSLEPLNHSFFVSTRVVHLKVIRRSDTSFNLLGVKFLNLSEKEKGQLIEYVTVKKVNFLKSEVFLEDNG